MDGIDLYVSPAGHDGWSGKGPDPTGSGPEGPFATLARARDAIRELRAAAPPGTPQGRITVWVRGGLYPLAQGVTFGPEDSGAPDAPVVYRAYGGEVARLVGGQRLDPAAFMPVTDTVVRERLASAAREHVRQIDLHATGVTELGAFTSRGFGRPTALAHMELFFNDKPMTVAQWPDPSRLGPDAGDFATITGFTKPMVDEWGRENGDLTGGFTYAGDRPRRWAPSDDIWVHGYWAHDWANSYERVNRLDPVPGGVETAPPGGNYHFAPEIAGVDRHYAILVVECADSVHSRGSGT